MAKAMDVEDLVIWAFRDQKIEAVAARLAGPSAGHGSTASNLAQILALGCRVDTSSAGAMHMAVQCHEDAAVMYDAVMALPAEACMLIIKHGRSATRPEWHEEGPGHWVTPVDKHGRPKKIWRNPSTQRGFLGYAPQELVGTHPAVVEEARRTYCVWWLGLCDLIGLLNGPDGLVDHEALKPDGAMPPWMVEGRAA
jgi:hypothetical protein